MNTNSYLTVNGQSLLNLKGERWKPVGDNYYISTFGRLVTSNHKNSGKLKLMKPAKDGSGYLRTVILINGKNNTIKVHRLVGQAFIPNPKNLETINHKNFDKSDNRVKNLEWMSLLENNRHAYANGRHGHLFKKGEKQHPNCLRRGSDNGIALLNESQVMEIREKYKPRIYTREKLAKEYGVTVSAIKDVLSRRSWKHVK